MEFDINFTRSAGKDYKNLPGELINKVNAILEEHIARDPYVVGKKLKGRWKGKYSYTFGNYRIVYQIFPKEKSVAILRIKPRPLAYR